MLFVFVIQHCCNSVISSVVCTLDQHQNITMKEIRIRLPILAFSLYNTLTGSYALNICVLVLNQNFVVLNFEWAFSFFNFHCFCKSLKNIRNRTTASRKTNWVYAFLVLFKQFSSSRKVLFLLKSSTIIHVSDFQTKSINLIRFASHIVPLT